MRGRGPWRSSTHDGRRAPALSLARIRTGYHPHSPRTRAGTAPRWPDWPRNSARWRAGCAHPRHSQQRLDQRVPPPRLPPLRLRHYMEIRDRVPRRQRRLSFSAPPRPPHLEAHRPPVPRRGQLRPCHHRLAPARLVLHQQLPVPQHLHHHPRAPVPLVARPRAHVQPAHPHHPRPRSRPPYDDLLIDTTIARHLLHEGELCGSLVRRHTACAERQSACAENVRVPAPFRSTGPLPRATRPLSRSSHPPHAPCPRRAIRSPPRGSAHAL